MDSDIEAVWIDDEAAEVALEVEKAAAIASAPAATRDVAEPSANGHTTTAATSRLQQHGSFSIYKSSLWIKLVNT